MKKDKKNQIRLDFLFILVLSISVVVFLYATCSLVDNPGAHLFILVMLIGGSIYSIRKIWLHRGDRIILWERFYLIKINTEIDQFLLLCHIILRAKRIKKLKTERIS